MNRLETRLQRLEGDPGAGLRAELAVLSDAEIAAVLEQHQRASGGDPAAWGRDLASDPACPSSVAALLRQDPEMAEAATRLAFAAWLRRAA